MNFSPRLVQILILLLNSDKPIPTSVIAEHLKISKRTISRELENVDKDLKQYDLILDRKSRKGISIVGKKSDKEVLKEYLEESDCFNPKNIKERHDRITLELLKQDDIQKIYYLASILTVSETTINNDLDTIKKWFEQNDIKLIRKTGLGIYLNYKEENYRKACMRYITSDTKDTLEKLSNIVDKNIIDRVKKVIQSIKSDKLKNISQSSYIELIAYMSIVTDRVIKNNIILDSNKQTIEIDDEDKNFMDELVCCLSKEFDICYSNAEIINIYVYIKGSKLQQLDKDNEIYEDNQMLHNMVCEMIERYDTSIAYHLKQDEDFIKGLIAHLKPTLIRLQYGIGIQNPYNEEVKNLYPDIYKKAVNCMSVISDYLELKVPEEETGLIAIHFGGAEAKIGRRHKLNRKVNLGVVCGSGIGISTLLCTRISHIFKDRVNVKRFALNDIYSKNIEDIDILISTFDLENYKSNYIKVNTILKEKDISTISEALDNVRTDTKVKSVDKGSLVKRIDEIELTSREISNIINKFQIYTVKSDITFNEMIDFASEATADNEADKKIIAHDLLKREKLSSQVVPEFEITLLHTKTKVIDTSKFIVVIPEDDEFKNEYFKKSKAVLVMIISDDDPRETLAISAISTAIFDDDDFLNDIKCGNQKKVINYIEKILKEFLINQIKSL